MDCTEPLVQDPYQERVRKWKKLSTAKHTNVRPHFAESLPWEVDCDYGIWRALNCLRVRVGRCGVDMVHWGYGRDEKCGCGKLQTSDHFLVCRQNHVAVACHWSGRI